MASLRMNLSNTLSPSTRKDLPGDDVSRSATQAQADREIKSLQAENKKLREDLAEMSSLYHQLVRENSHETFDERRVNLLKSQLIQLERQVLMMADALGSRSAVLLEVENSLVAIADCCRGRLETEKTSNKLTFDRSEVTQMVETAESGRIKLYKSIEGNTVERMGRPLLMMDKYIRQNTWEPVTLMDVCSGKLEHINLKHVAKLESRLAQLYKQLIATGQSLQSVIVPPRNAEDKPSSNQQVPKAVFDRLAVQVAKSGSLLQEVSAELLDLTVLMPSAPWPSIQKPYLKDVTSERVLEALPAFPRSRAQEGKEIVESLMRAVTYSNHMASLQTQACKDELAFHQSIYQEQCNYIESLFYALKDGYGQFEESVNEMLCQPLNVMLKSYQGLKNTASEEALKTFLQTFKDHEPKVSEAVAQLDKHKEKGEGDTLSVFGNAFCASLQKQQEKCQYDRDNTMAKLDDLRQQREEAIEQLQSLLPPPKVKETPAGTPSQESKNMIEDVVNGTESLSLDTPSKESKKAKTPAKRPSLGNINRKNAKLAPITATSSPEGHCDCGAEDKQPLKKNIPKSSSNDLLERTLGGSRGKTKDLSPEPRTLGPRRGSDFGSRERGKTGLRLPSPVTPSSRSSSSDTRSSVSSIPKSRGSATPTRIQRLVLKPAARGSNSQNGSDSPS